MPVHRRFGGTYTSSINVTSSRAVATHCTLCPNYLLEVCGKAREFHRPNNFRWLFGWRKIRLSIISALPWFVELQVVSHMTLHSGKDWSLVVIGIVSSLMLVAYLWLYLESFKVLAGKHYVLLSSDFLSKSVAEPNNEANLYWHHLLSPFSWICCNWLARSWLLPLLPTAWELRWWHKRTFGWRSFPVHHFEINYNFAIEDDFITIIINLSRLWLAGWTDSSIRWRFHVSKFGLSHRYYECCTS